MLRRDDRRQLRQNQAAHSVQVLLPLQHPTELGEVGLEPVLLGILPRGIAQVANHLIGGVFQRRHFAACLARNRTRQIALGYGGRHLGNRAHLSGQVCRQLIDVFGKSFPRASRARHLGLPAQFAFHADFARDRCHLIGKRRQRIDHAVDGVGQCRDFAFGLHREFLLQVAISDCCHHLSDAAHLAGEVTRHEVDAVGQVLPRTRHALHVGLPTQDPLGPDLARDARYFRRKRAQLIDHRVDGVLQL